MSEFSRLKQRIDNLRATGNPVPAALCIRFEELRPRLGKRPKLKKAKKVGQRATRRRSFYSSREWRELRYDVLVARGARCECCGASPKTGAVMNVDHIVPVSRAWERRLDPNNLQILCGSCNAGKGARSTEDWRN